MRGAVGKRILITGALGHIGSAFIHSLKPGEYDEVVLLDDMSAQRYCSLFRLPDGVPFRFIEADVCKADLKKLFHGVDVVVHLAAITDAVSSFGKVDEVERVNFDATRLVSEACVETNARLVFPSTTSVYGVQDEVVDEACTPEQLKPQSPYAVAKLKSEQLLPLVPGLEFVIVRMGTIFGTSPGMRFHTAVNKFIWQACLGQSITVWRTAMDQKRPYLAVTDAVRALDFIVRGGHFDRSLYNVVTLNATVGQIIDSIRRDIPDAAVTLVDSPIMNQFSYDVSNARFRGLGFAFEGNLDFGVRATIEWLKNTRTAH